MHPCAPSRTHSQNSASQANPQRSALHAPVQHPDALRALAATAASRRARARALARTHPLEIGHVREEGRVERGDANERL